MEAEQLLTVLPKLSLYHGGDRRCEHFVSGLEAWPKLRVRRNNGAAAARDNTAQVSDKPAHMLVYLFLQISKANG